METKKLQINIFGVDKLEIKIVPIEELKPLEYVFPTHLKNLRNMILNEGFIKYPLVIEKKNKIVLDGSHRYVFFMMEGFKMVPVLEVDYDNPHVRVGLHRMERFIINGTVGISKSEVIRRGVTGDLFPPRTTRHFIPFLRPKIDIPLEKLVRTEKADMNWIIAKVSIAEEINHNKKYIKELEEEEQELKNYMKECYRTKKYLKEQIEEMKK